MKHQKGISLLEALLGVATLVTVIIVAFNGYNRSHKVCIAEKTISEIVSVSRQETTVKYTDGTFQRVSTLSGVAVGDVKCLAYQ